MNGGDRLQGGRQGLGLLELLALGIVGIVIFTLVITYVLDPAAEFISCIMDRGADVIACNPL
jgi:uncharacterized membrane protein